MCASEHVAFVAGTEGLFEQSIATPREPRTDSSATKTLHTHQLSSSLSPACRKLPYRPFDDTSLFFVCFYRRDNFSTLAADTVRAFDDVVVKRDFTLTLAIAPGCLVLFNFIYSREPVLPACTRAFSSRASRASLALFVNTVTAWSSPHLCCFPKTTPVYVFSSYFFFLHCFPCIAVL